MRLLDNPNGQWLAGPRWRRRNSGGTPTIVALMTGTVGNVVIAEDRASLGMALSDSSTITAHAWGISRADVDGAASLGTASTPADLSSLVGSTLWGKATAGGIGYYASHLISANPPVYAVQPTTAGTLAVGNILTLEPGEATGLGAVTYAVTSLVLDGVDKTADVDQDTFEWATTDLIVYGAGGAFSYVVTAANEGGSVDSDTITGTLIDVPDAYAPGDWSVAPGADGQIEVTITAHPDNGNAAVSDIEYKIGAGAWTPSGGTGSFTITGESPGLKAIQIQDVNAAGTGLPSEIKQVTVTGGVSVDPVVSSAVYTAGSGGSPALLEVENTYAGSDTLTVYAVTGNDPVTVSKAQLKAGSGGTNTLEFYNYGYNYPTDTANITGLTAASEGADRILFYVEEDVGGGSSAIQTVVVSGLDYTAPAFASAATNTSGNTITVTMDQATFGAGATADWVVKINAAPTSLATVTVNDTTSVVIALLSAAVASGDTVTVSYTAGDLRDANGNLVVDFADQAVTNNMTAFVEAGVLSATGRYITAGAAITAAPGFLYFGSYVPSADQRRYLLSWDKTSGYVRADSVGGDSLIDVATRIQAGTGVGIANPTLGGMTTGDRIHVLLTGTITGTAPYTLTGTLAVWDATGGAWRTNAVSVVDNTYGPNLYFSAVAPRIGERNSTTGAEFSGTFFRNAFWTFADAANVPDITTATVQDYFTSGGGLIVPSISQGALSAGARLVDLYGDAADYNAGPVTHDGSMTLTKTGTYVNA